MSDNIVIPAQAGTHGRRLTSSVDRTGSMGPGFRRGDGARVALFAILFLAACGKQQNLRPASGHALPQKPLVARTTPTARDLLAPPPLADPERVDELLQKSQERREDRFDLPPPGRR